VNAHEFDSFAHHSTAHLSRRTSFAVLGALGMTALVQPALTEAKKNRSKKKDKQRCNTQLADCNAQAAQCAAQVDQCTSFFDNLCPSGDPLCEAERACCSSLGNCDANGFVLCLFTSNQRVTR
jgi:hypothetical protein